MFEKITDDITNTIDYLRDNYFKIGGLVVSVVLAEGVLRLIDKEILYPVFFQKIKSLTGVPILLTRMGYYGVSAVLLFFIWTFARAYLPKIKKGKLGIVFCITSEAGKEGNKFKDEFIEKIYRSLVDSGLAHKTQILPLNDIQSNKIGMLLDENKSMLIAFLKNDDSTIEAPSKKWIKIKSRLGGRFFIWGKIKKLDKTNLRFDINGCVVHSKIKKEAQRKLAGDFGAIWSEHNIINRESGVYDCQVTAENVYYAVKYMVGCAALASNDLDLAYGLHHDLFNEIKALSGFRPQLEEIKTRINALVCDELSLKAVRLALTKHEDEAIKTLEIALNILPLHYNALLNLAMAMYLVRRPLTSVLEVVRKAKNHAGSNSNWRYSEALVLLMMGKHKDSMVLYNQISRTKDGDASPLFVVRFNEAEYQTTKKPEHLFVMGYLNHHKLGLLPQALKNYEDFISATRGRNDYLWLMNKALAYLDEVKRGMEIK